MVGLSGRCSRPASYLYGSGRRPYARARGTIIVMSLLEAFLLPSKQPVARLLCKGHVHCSMKSKGISISTLGTAGHLNDQLPMVTTTSSFFSSASMTSTQSCPRPEVGGV